MMVLNIHSIFDRDVVTLTFKIMSGLYITEIARYKIVVPF